MTPFLTALSSLSAASALFSLRTVCEFWREIALEANREPHHDPSRVTSTDPPDAVFARDVLAPLLLASRLLSEFWRERARRMGLSGENGDQAGVAVCFLQLLCETTVAGSLCGHA